MAAKRLYWLIGIIWVVSCVNLYLLDSRWIAYGIQPRNLDGLIGIIVWPLLHGDFWHLVGNTVPIAVLGGLIAFLEGRRFVKITVFVSIVAGIGVWIFAREGSHIGASGIVFGYFGYIVARGFYKGGFGAIALGLIVLAVYAAMFSGIIPTESRISWEGHLCGLLAGAWSARKQYRK